MDLRPYKETLVSNESRTILLLCIFINPPKLPLTLLFFFLLKFIPALDIALVLDSTTDKDREVLGVYFAGRNEKENIWSLPFGVVEMRDHNAETPSLDCKKLS